MLIFGFTVGFPTNAVEPIGESSIAASIGSGLIFEIDYNGGKEVEQLKEDVRDDELRHGDQGGQAVEAAQRSPLEPFGQPEQAFHDQ
jgi:hypothetical protein